MSKKKLDNVSVYLESMVVDMKQRALTVIVNTDKAVEKQKLTHELAGVMKEKMMLLESLAESEGLKEDTTNSLKREFLVRYQMVGKAINKAMLPSSFAPKIKEDIRIKAIADVEGIDKGVLDKASSIVKGAEEDAED